MVLDDISTWELLPQHRTTTRLSDDNEDGKVGSEGREITIPQVDAYRHAACRGGIDSAQNAVAMHDARDLSIRRRDIDFSQYNFSVSLLDQGNMPATNQKDSGRCWMFGTLNLFRFGTRNKMHLSNFEFSESYPYFFHLLEQSNAFLELVRETKDRPIEDCRVLSEFLDQPLADSGDWGIAVNLIQKYGLVPKSVFPETHSSGNTESLVGFLTDRLRRVAHKIRTAPPGDAMFEQTKEATLADIFRILSIHLGTPPTEFEWKWRDTSGKFQSTGKMSPQVFRDTYVEDPFRTYVSLIQDPRNEYYCRYTVQYSNSVLGSNDVVFLNIPADEMKSYSVAMLQNGHPVWFACNVDAQCDFDRGVWDSNLLEYDKLYGIASPPLPLKQDRIRFGSPMGTHVMLITGVDLDQDSGAPIR